MLKQFHKNFSSTWQMLAVFAITLAAGSLYIIKKRTCSTTQDARIMTNVIPIASTVNGIVTHVKIKDNQKVAQGQVLFELSSDDIKHNMLEGKARIAVMKQTFEASTAQLKQVQKELHRREEVVDHAKTDLQNAQKQLNTRAMTRSEFNHVSHHLKTASSELREQQETVTYVKTRLEHHKMMLHEAQIDFDKAKSNENNLVVRAPIGGYISNFSLHEGAAIRSYHTLFGIIQPKPVWVIANFLETELDKIRPGQRAQVSVKMYPHHVFTGKVESIGYGITVESESEMNQVLPHVATNNFWIKLTQRFPVRIRVDMPDEKFPLRVGANAKVKILVR